MLVVIAIFSTSISTRNYKNPTLLQVCFAQSTFLLLKAQITQNMLLSASQHDGHFTQLKLRNLRSCFTCEKQNAFASIFYISLKIFVEYFFHFPLLTFQLNLQPLSVVVLVANYLQHKIATKRSINQFKSYPKLKSNLVSQPSISNEVAQQPPPNYISRRVD